MKSKAKPVKGSARTKRFDVGGTVGALAGLGTLAYLMSRKKKGAAGAEGPEFKPQGKFPSEDGSGTSGSGGTTTKVDDAGKQRALQQSKDPKSNLVPEGADRDTLYESDKALVRTDGGKTTPVVKKKSAVVSQQNQNKKRQGSGSSTSNLAPKAGEKKDVTTSLKERNAVTLEKGTGTKPATSSVDAFNRKARADNLGTQYKDMYNRLQDKNIPEGPGKEALKKAVAKAKQDYDDATKGLKRGGAVKKYASGGSVKASGMGSVKTAKPSMGSASKRADGIAQRGKTRGKVC
jgi:hypothetical protein